MARLECDRRRAEGVTLVELTLESDVAERVALEPTHEGPLWPPRRQGAIESGWSADGWVGVVPADEPLALGYATPVDPADPPVRIADRRVPSAESPPASPRAVLRALGDSRPPSDAVEPARDRDPSPTHPSPDRAQAAAGVDRSGTSRPGAVDLDAVAARLDRAESLATADSAEAARETVAAAGGAEAVADLADRVDRDREQLAALEERVARLRERAALDVPLEDLARLA